MLGVASRGGCIDLDQVREHLRCLRLPEVMADHREAANGSGELLGLLGGWLGGRPLGAGRHADATPH